MTRHVGRENRCEPRFDASAPFRAPWGLQAGVCPTLIKRAFCCGSGPAAADQHLDTHTQLAASFEFRKFRSYLLSDGMSRRIGQRQVYLRHRADTRFDRLPILVEAIKPPLPRLSFDPNLVKPGTDQQTF
jgi:hypothetical protein